MKFSVLLPTRNRLQYLRYAITSVLEQDYNDWEIIVSDNCSEEDIEGYIKSLNESRIKYQRTAYFVSVTDNWNNAIDMHTGDYIIMLGDDDCLLKGYFTTCLKLLQTHDFPEMLYSSAYIYMYPSVLEQYPNGKLETLENASFLLKKELPYLLDHPQRIALVKKTLRFNMMFTFNAQFSLLSSGLVRRLKTKYGPFYQSPYPDFYSTIAVLLQADKVLAVPSRLVIIGVSPKSFGFYYFNYREKEGKEMLNHFPEKDLLLKLDKILLPGSDMNTSWMFSMEYVKTNFEKEYNLSINYKKYRFLQVVYNCTKKRPTVSETYELLKKLRLWELLAYAIPIHCAIGLLRISQRVIRKTVHWLVRCLYSIAYPRHGKAQEIPVEKGNILDALRSISK